MGALSALLWRVCSGAVDDVLLIALVELSGSKAGMQAEEKVTKMYRYLSLLSIARVPNVAVHPLLFI